MAELQTADVEAILAPVSEDQPTGVDVRADFTPSSIYFRLRDARSDARDAERQAEGHEAQVSEEALQIRWRPVATLAAQALTETTKDLEIATWLTEALVRTAGLEGLMAGASIIGGLVERYWDDVFPLPEEGDIEGRLAAVAGLSGQGADGTLMQPLRKLFLFPRLDGSPFFLWQYQASIELAGIDNPERREQRIEAGVVPFETVEKEARLADLGHWSSLHETLVQVRAAWEHMGQVLDEKAGPASPSGIRVREALDLMLDACNRFGPQTVAADQPNVAGGEVAATTTGTAMAAAGAISGREQALRQLGEIAEWFKRNEPNSPIGYTLDEAMRRARMAWPEMVAELIADEASRTMLLTSLGMKRPEPPAE